MVMMTMIDGKNSGSFFFFLKWKFDLVTRKVCVKIELALTKIRPLGFQI